jgi:hypothetical protein
MANEPPTPKMGTVAVVLTTDPETGETTVDTKSATRTLAARMGDSESEITIEHWVETFSDEREITTLEQAIQSGNPFPLQSVYDFRARAEREDAEFGDYVEDLLCQKAVRPEVQSHGIAWLRSKMKIEQFRQQEREAAEVIANFALAKYKDDPNLADFVLAGPGVQVRIRIFKVRLAPGSSAAAA